MYFICICLCVYTVRALAHMDTESERVEGEGRGEKRKGESSSGMNLFVFQYFLCFFFVQIDHEGTTMVPLYLLPVYLNLMCPVNSDFCLYVI